MLDEAHMTRLTRVALLALTCPLVIARAVIEAVERAWFGLTTLTRPACGAHALLLYTLAAVEAERVTQLVLARRAMPSLAAHALVAVTRIPAADTSSMACAVLGALVKVNFAGLPCKPVVALAHAVSATTAVATADIGADGHSTVGTRVPVLALAGCFMRAGPVTGAEARALDLARLARVARFAGAFRLAT